MSKIYVLASLVGLAATSYGQTPISGMVLNHGGATLTAPANHPVTISFDSTAAWSHAPVTFYTSMNGSGQFSGTLPAGIPNLTYLNITSPDPCFGTYTSRYYYSSAVSSISLGIDLCMSRKPAGKVLLGSTMNGAANARVYYIRKCYDSVLNTYVLSAPDSTVTDASGNYTISNPVAVSGGCTYLLKAALQPGSPNYSSYLPTYYTGSLSWSGATALPYPHSGQQNISLAAGSNPGGPAFIGGSVLVGANKSTAVGDPLSARILILTDQADRPVAYTYSAADGSFSFPGLAYGTYKLYGDAPGKLNPVLNVTVNATVPRVANILFEENNRKFEGHLATTSVGSLPGALDGIRLYPNPAQEVLHIGGLDALPGTKTVTILNALGQEAFRQTILPGKAAALPVTGLPAGTWLVRVVTGSGTATWKMNK